LCRLPEPDEGDMFFDFEGDPFVGESGREYLFGWIYKNEYSALWAITDEEELQAFEKYIDEVKKIRQQHPGMHIYHFSQYEPTALKRLMGKYGTREN
jgi:predicted RecB family nuclease